MGAILLYRIKQASFEYCSYGNISNKEVQVTVNRQLQMSKWYSSIGMNILS